MRPFAVGLRRSSLFLLLPLLLVTSSAFAGTPGACDPTCQTCAGPGANDCVSCPSGRYRINLPGSCAECTPIDSCSSGVTCSSATNSQCDTCDGEHYLQNG